MNNTDAIKYDKKKKFSSILKIRELGICFIIIIIVVVTSAIQPKFLIYENLRSILLYLPLLITVAMGEMMAIVSRNFDLSVGSILGFSGMSIGLIFIAYPQFPIIIAFILSMIIGGVLGLINGFIITSFKLPSIIVTLGTMSIIRGILYIISGGRQVSPNNIPESLIRMSQTSGFPIPGIVIIAILVAVITALFLKFTHIGREIYTVGSNPTAANLRGIDVKKVIILVFIISGALAGLAGIMYASRFGVLNPNQTGVGFEFIVLAATIIGGTSVSGGSGSVLGTLLGCILLGVVNTSLAVIGISGNWQLATFGIIIVSALIIDKLLKNKIQST